MRIDREVLSSFALLSNNKHDASVDESVSLRFVNNQCQGTSRERETDRQTDRHRCLHDCDNYQLRHIWGCDTDLCS